MKYLKAGKTAVLSACLWGAMSFAANAAELVIAHAGDPETLDPAFRTGTLTGDVQRQLYDTVLFRNSAMEFEPMLAESVEQVDPTHWVIKLRPGLTFSNGEPIDAEAVRFSLQRILDPKTKSPIRGWWKNLTEFEIIDARTLHVTTDGVDPLFEARMTLLAPVPPKYVAEIGDAAFARNPVSSGHYRLVEWTPGEAVVLEANPDYYGEQPAFDQVTYRNMPEELARIAALQAGEVDVITNVSPIQSLALQGSEGFEIRGAASTRVMVVQFDINQAPGDNAKFREAVSYAIDRDAINQGLLRGFGVKVNSLLSPGIPGWPREQSFVNEYDPDRARQLVEEAGLGDSEILMRLGGGQFPLDIEIAQAIGAQLRAVGLNVTVRSDERGVFIGDLKNHSVSPLYLMGQGNIWADPYPQIQAFHQTDGFLSTWADPELDALLERSSTVSGAARAAVFGEALTRIQDTNAAVPLFAQQFLYGVNSDIAWQPRTDAKVFAFEMTPAK